MSLTNFQIHQNEFQARDKFPGTYDAFPETYEKISRIGRTMRQENDEKEKKLF